MTQSEYEAELLFRLCKSIFATLAIRGIIAEDDLHILLRAAVEKYHGLSFGLLSSISFPDEIEVELFHIAACIRLSST